PQVALRRHALAACGVKVDTARIIYLGPDRARATIDCRANDDAAAAAVNWAIARDHLRARLRSKATKNVLCVSDLTSPLDAPVCPETVADDEEQDFGDWDDDDELDTRLPSERIADMGVGWYDGDVVDW